MKKVAETIVNKNYERLDKFIVEWLNVNRSYVTNLFNEALVFVNEQQAKKSGMSINANDKVTIYEKVTQAPDGELKEFVMDLNILYDDKDIIIVYKPSGLLSHQTQFNEQATMQNAIYTYFKKTISPLIVHRLDKDTSGLIIFAKNKQAQELMLELFQKRKIEKKYYALVHGKIPKAHLLIDAPISRASDNKLKMVVGKFKNAKESITEVWEVECWNKKYSLLDVKLHTGRTHQIRAHLKYINCPIINDQLYSSDRSMNSYNQYLMAYHLNFIHPISQQPIDIKIDMDKEFKTMIEQIKANN